MVKRSPEGQSVLVSSASTFTVQTSLLKIGRLLHKIGFVDSQLLPTVHTVWARGRMEMLLFLRTGISKWSFYHM